jgi:hypothetical protein
MSREGSLDHRKHDDSLVLANGERGVWTLHDLRRTGGTLMQAMGVPLDVIDRCQNHKLPGPKVRRHYLHHDYASEKRDAWNRLGQHLETILSAAASSKQVARKDRSRGARTTTATGQVLAGAE